jgi:hypothetical protein
MPDLLDSAGLDALLDTPRFAVYLKPQRPGARWKRLGTFPSEGAANKFMLSSMNTNPRHDWGVRRETTDTPRGA